MSQISQSQPVSSNKEYWLLCIETVADVMPRPAQLKDSLSAYNEVKKHALQILHDQSNEKNMRKPRLKLYSCAIFDESYGGVLHLRRQSLNMVSLGFSIYHELCGHLSRIEQVHIIATESGAYLALKMVEFIGHYGASLEWDNGFYPAWTSYIAMHELLGEPVDDNILFLMIKTVAVIHPSLARPSGISYFLGNLMRRKIYDHQKRNLPGSCDPLFLVKHLKGDHVNEELDVSPALVWESTEEYLFYLQKCVNGHELAMHQVKDCLKRNNPDATNLYGCQACTPIDLKEGHFQTR